MATKKRKSTTRRTAARRKKAEQRLPAGLGTLFGGLLLMVLAFVQGDSAPLSGGFVRSFRAWFRTHTVFPYASCHVAQLLSFVSFLVHQSQQLVHVDAVDHAGLLHGLTAG